MFKIDTKQMGVIGSYLKQIGISFNNDEEIKNAILFLKYYSHTSGDSPVNTKFNQVLEGISINNDNCIINSNAATILNDFANNYLKPYISQKAKGLVGICGGFPVYHTNADWSTWNKFTKRNIPILGLCSSTSPTGEEKRTMFDLIECRYVKYASSNCHLEFTSLNPDIFVFKSSQLVSVYRSQFTSAQNFGLFFVQSDTDKTNEYPYGLQYLMTTSSGGTATGSGSRAILKEIIPIMNGSINTGNLTLNGEEVITKLPEKSNELYSDVPYSDIVHNTNGTITFSNLTNDNQGGLSISGLPSAKKSDSSFYYYMNGGDN